MKSGKSNHLIQVVFVPLFVIYCFVMGGWLTYSSIRNHVDNTEKYESFELVEGTVEVRRIGMKNFKPWYNVEISYEGKPVIETKWAIRSEPKDTILLIRNAATGEYYIAEKDYVTRKYVANEEYYLSQNEDENSKTDYLLGGLLALCMGVCFLGVLMLSQDIGMIILSMGMIGMGLTGIYFTIFAKAYFTIILVAFGATGVLMLRSYFKRDDPTYVEEQEKLSETVVLEIVDIIKNDDGKQYVLFEILDDGENEYEKNLVYSIDSSIDSGFKTGLFYSMDHRRVENLIDYLEINGKKYLDVSVLPRSNFEVLSKTAQKIYHNSRS